MISIRLTNDNHAKPSDTSVHFTTDGFEKIIESGLFKLPHVDLFSSERAIDLRVHRDAVLKILSPLADDGFPLPELITLITMGNYTYLVGNG